MTQNNFTIRLANDDDFEQIFNIWIEGISSSFDTTSISENELKEKFKSNFFKRVGIFNFWVSVSENNEIAGWQSLNKCTVNPLKENHFAESSTYVKKEFRKFGVGEMLLSYVVETAYTSSIQYIIAYVTSVNTATRTIGKKIGFVEIGQLPKSNKASFALDKIFIVKPV